MCLLQGQINIFQFVRWLKKLLLTLLLLYDSRNFCKSTASWKDSREPSLRCIMTYLSLKKKSSAAIWGALKLENLECNQRSNITCFRVGKPKNFPEKRNLLETFQRWKETSVSAARERLKIHSQEKISSVWCMVTFGTVMSRTSQGGGSAI